MQPAGSGGEAAAGLEGWYRWAWQRSMGNWDACCSTALKAIPAPPPPPFLQAVSINLSPNTIGQVAMSLMVNPPQPGDASYAQWKEEHDEGLASLRRRAHAMTDGFNALDGVTCTFTEGAM